MRTSVVIPAYDSWSTLPLVLEALEPQIDGVERELILVESTGTATAEELERRWPWVRVLAPPARMLPGAARNLAIAAARGHLIAFTDADAVPERGWLDELERAVGPGVDAVAGAIVNGTPRSVVGTGGYLLEFVEWLPSRVGPPPHGATCNLLVRRDALERHGAFVPDIWPGEDTVVTYAIAVAGGLVFAPSARVRHLNRTSLAPFIRHQYRLGASFAAICRQIEFPRQEYARLPWAPGWGVIRVVSLCRRLVRWQSVPHRFPLLMPAIAVGAFAWSAGLTAALIRDARR